MHAAQPGIHTDCRVTLMDRALFYTVSEKKMEQGRNGDVKHEDFWHM